MLIYTSLCAVSSTGLGVLDGHLRGEGHWRAAAAGTDARNYSADGVLHGEFGCLLSCTEMTEKETNVRNRRFNTAPQQSWLLHDDRGQEVGFTRSSRDTVQQLRFTCYYVEPEGTGGTGCFKPTSKRAAYGCN